MGDLVGFLWLISIPISIGIGIAAHRRGWRGFHWFGVSLFFTPIVAVVLWRLKVRGENEDDERQ